MDPLAWKLKVWDLDKGKCRNCRKPVAKHAGRFVWQAHHIIPKSWLRRFGFHLKVWDMRNGMLLCFGCHSRHENGSVRILREKIPRRFWSFLSEVDGYTPEMLERIYPAAGSSGDDDDPGREDGRRNWRSRAT